MPSAGDQICSSGTVNAGIGVQILLDLGALVIPGVDIPAAFNLITSALGVAVLVTTDFCSNPPRYPGDPTLQDLVDWGNNVNHDRIVQKYQQLLLYNYWPVVCTCTTYIPPNIVFPPGPAFPGGSPPLPSQSQPLDLTCTLSLNDNKLNQILALLNLVLATVGPQSHTIGTPHTVTGTGEIPVSGIVGVITHGLSYYPGVSYELSDPPRYFDTGWIAFGDSDGWYEHKRIVHDPQYHIVPTTGITKVGYDAGMTSSLEITELLPRVLYVGN